MKKGKSNFLVSTILILLAIVFTILVKVVDVQLVGANETSIGFAKVNMLVFKSIGVNMAWYHITDWLGLVPIFIAIVYAIIGVIQLVKRKSLFKVDKEIIILGIFYIVVIAIYVLFEKVIINYRPLLMNGYLEVSYPSSHTLMAICLCGSSIIINKKLFKNKFSKFINIISAIVILVTITGRLISGVHWFTDIVGGIIISISLLTTLHSIIEKIIKED
jgi:undecaprenyl-diphosphatase